MYRSSWGRDFRRGATLSLGDGGGVFSVIVAVLVPLIGLLLFLRRRRLADVDRSAGRGWRDQTKRGYKAFFGTIGVGILFASVSAALLSGPELPVYGIAALVALLALPLILVFALDLGATADEDGWRRRTRRGFNRLFCSIGILSYVMLALAVVLYECDPARIANAVPPAIPQLVAPQVEPNTAQGEPDIASHSCPSGFVFVEAGTIAAKNPAAGTGKPPPAAAPALTIARSICVQATEVTQGQWERAMGNNPSFFSDCGEDCPVDQVSWFDAVEYANARSRQEGLPACYDGFYFVGAGCTGYRLPTDDEWTYAAQGGVAAAPIADLDAVSWNPKNSDKKPHPTRSRQPNGLGLYDTLGGVWEWTQDEYSEFFWSGWAAGSRETPRFLRGGSWYTLPEEAPAAARTYNFPDRKLFHVGLRLVKTWVEDQPLHEGSGSQAAPPPAATAGCPLGFARIEPGTFTMGASSANGRDEVADPHSVALTRAFCMKLTEVTQSEWQATMGGNPALFRTCGSDCPVEQVSWFDAVHYTDALNRQIGLGSCYTSALQLDPTCEGFRLPTEAEWEFAATAGADAAHYAIHPRTGLSAASATLDPVGWYRDNSSVSYLGGMDCADWQAAPSSLRTCGTHAVGQKLPNRWGLYDMLGNVWEWTGDWRAPYPDRYQLNNKAALDPPGPATGTNKVLRGGAWNFPEHGLRAAFRNSAKPHTASSFVGFRLARTASVSNVLATQETAAASGSGSGSGSGTDTAATPPPGTEDAAKAAGAHATEPEGSGYVDTTMSYPDLINLVDADLPACLGPSALCPEFSGSDVSAALRIGDASNRKEYLVAFDFNTTIDGGGESCHSCLPSYGTFAAAESNGSEKFSRIDEGNCGTFGYPCSVSTLKLSERVGAFDFSSGSLYQGYSQSQTSLYLISTLPMKDNSVFFPSDSSNGGAVVCDSEGSEDSGWDSLYEFSATMKLEQGANPDFPDILVLEEVTATPCNGDAEVTRQTRRFRFESGGYRADKESIGDGF